MSFIALLLCNTALSATRDWTATCYGNNASTPNLVASWETSIGGTGIPPGNFPTAVDVLITVNGK